MNEDTQQQAEAITVAMDVLTAALVAAGYDEGRVLDDLMRLMIGLDPAAYLIFRELLDADGERADD
jgi:hypothetical protein